MPLEVKAMVALPAPGVPRLLDAVGLAMLLREVTRRVPFPMVVVPV